MSEWLYLDTARLGKITPSTFRAVTDLVRLNAEQGSTLYFDEFLHGGFSALPDSIGSDFPGLNVWTGMDGLFARCKRLVGELATVELASSSEVFMKVAAQQLVSRCQRILITDLTWNRYEAILRQAADESNSKIHKLRLRELILNGQVSGDEACQQVYDYCLHNRCDGMLLPVIDNFGIRLPFEAILSKTRPQLKLVVADASQAIGQTDIQPIVDLADFVVAGAHKWLGSYVPLGIGVFGRSSTKHSIESSIVDGLAGGKLHDSILQFASTTKSGHTVKETLGTINLMPLFAFSAALFDHELVDPEIDFSWKSNGSTWIPKPVHPDFKSRIQLMENTSFRFSSPEALRSQFREHNVAVSTYPAGLVRFGFPMAGWDDEKTLQFSQVLTAVNKIH